MTVLLNTKIALGRHFTQHLSVLSETITSAQSDLLWQDIARRYQQPQRAYHTLTHIQHMFIQFERIKHCLYEPHMIGLAIYYHDVIYEPTRSDNEWQSAKYAVDELRCYLSAEQCQHIYALIMMTATHKLDEWVDKNKVSDAAYLLDMDLSILGAPWPEYQKYAQAVRQEYTHVSDDDYRVGRIKVLQGLLANSTLYLTDYYYARLEQQARANVTHEITLLHAS